MTYINLIYEHVTESDITYLTSKASSIDETTEDRSTHHLLKRLGANKLIKELWRTTGDVGYVSEKVGVGVSAVMDVIKRQGYKYCKPPYMSFSDLICIHGEIELLRARYTHGISNSLKEELANKYDIPFKVVNAIMEKQLGVIGG